MSRNTAATAQIYADLYYDTTPYNPKEAFNILTAIIILASKYCDTKSLHISTISYILDIDPSELAALEMEVCWKLDFDLSWHNYVLTVDHAIEELRNETGIDLYEEN